MPLQTQNGSSIIPDPQKWQQLQNSYLSDLYRTWFTQGSFEGLYYTDWGETNGLSHQQANQFYYELREKGLIEASRGSHSPVCHNELRQIAVLRTM
jgi:hypothetical protein